MANRDLVTRPSNTRWLAVAFAVPALALGFVPIANWIPGGHAAPWYSAIAAEWMSGSAIVIGIGLVLAILSRRVDGLWRDGPRRASKPRPRRRGFSGLSGGDGGERRG